MKALLIAVLLLGCRNNTARARSNAVSGRCSPQDLQAASMAAAKPSWVTVTVDPSQSLPEADSMFHDIPQDGSSSSVYQVTLAPLNLHRCDAEFLSTGEVIARLEAQEGVRPATLREAYAYAKARMVVAPQVDLVPFGSYAVDRRGARGVPVFSRSSNWGTNVRACSYGWGSDSRFLVARQ